MANTNVIVVLLAVIIISICMSVSLSSVSLLLTSTKTGSADTTNPAVIAAEAAAQQQQNQDNSSDSPFESPQLPEDFYDSYPEEKTKDEDTNKVTLYAKANYKVEIGKYGVGQYNLKGKFANSVSSIKVPKGLKIYLFDKTNLKDALGVVKNDIKQLPKGVADKADSFAVKKS